MKYFRWRLFHKDQSGFTLIELLASIAIMGIISLGASASSVQIMNQTSRDRDYTLANLYVTNAINWISRDALMAQTTNGSSGFPNTTPLALSWTSWDNRTCSANYSVVNGELKRIYSDGINVSTTSIAQCINVSGNLTCCVSGNGTLTVTVTSSVGQGARVVDITKTREITCRPKL